MVVLVAAAVEVASGARPEQSFPVARSSLECSVMKQVWSKSDQQQPVGLNPRPAASLPVQDRAASAWRRTQHCARLVDKKGQLGCSTPFHIDGRRAPCSHLRSRISHSNSLSYL